MKQIIIDTDPGIDDTMAIYFALNSPELEVIGLTTVYGNTSNIQGTENALRILEIANKEGIPVHTGASKPLMTQYLGKGEIVHGIDGQGNSNLIKPKIKEGEISAINFMKNKIKLAEYDDFTIHSYYGRQTYTFCCLKGSLLLDNIELSNLQLIKVPHLSYLKIDSKGMDYGDAHDTREVLKWVKGKVA